jgi:cell division septal protein FtsQ
MKTRFIPKASGKLQLKRRRIFVAKVLAAIAVVVLLVSGLSWLSFSDALAVENITVSGNTTLDADVLQVAAMQQAAGAYLSLFSKQNIILYPHEYVQNFLLFEFPRIKEVKVKRNFTKRTAAIQLSEREPYALWCRGAAQETDSERCYYLDEGGYVFEEVSAENENEINLSVFRGGSLTERGSILRGRLNAEQFPTLRKLIDELHSGLNLDVRAININGSDVELLIEPDWILKLALDKELDLVPANLQAVFSEYNLLVHPENIEYVDLRFDERAYYKLRE